MPQSRALLAVQEADDPGVLMTAAATLLPDVRQHAVQYVHLTRRFTSAQASAAAQWTQPQADVVMKRHTARPVEDILVDAAEVRAAVIVVRQPPSVRQGTTRAGPGRLLGQLLARSDTPLLVIPHAWRPPGAQRRLLIHDVRQSQAARPALEAARTLCPAQDDRALDVLHVLPGHPALNNTIFSHSGDPAITTSPWYRQHLVRARAGLPDQGGTEFVRMGDVGQIGGAFLDPHRYRLAVMGADAQSALHCWWFGMEAERLVRGAAIPVLIVPSGGGEDPGGS